MASITNSLKDSEEMYSGYDSIKVGIGLSQPNIYASTAYALKKQSVLWLGGLADIIYSGFEEDRQPQILSIKLEPQYNTVLAFNLHYVPMHFRQAILKVALAMNKPRIEQNLPMYIDYHYIKRHIPQSEYIVRRYKVTGLNVIGNVPLIDWPKAIRGPSGWQKVYLQHSPSGARG